MYIECKGTEFGTLQIRRHIRSVEITSVDCTYKSLLAPHSYTPPLLTSISYT